MNKSEIQLKMILYGCIICYVCSLCFGMITAWRQQDMSGVGMGVVAMFTPLIIPVIFRIKKLQTVYEIYIVSTIFMFFSSLLGSVFHWYHYPGFDKIVHFVSGWLATTLAVMLFFYLQKSNTFCDQGQKKIFFIFINAVNIAVSAVWEFYEYAMLVFFNNDGINHYTQGVHDSMTDMLCATAAGCILTIWIIRYMKTGKTNFFINVYEKFYDRNVKIK